MSPGRATLIAFVPTTVVLYLWVLVAPGIYGVSGWGGVGVLFFLGPLTILFLLVVLLLVLASRRRPRAFSLPQAGAVWTMWAALALGGFVFADSGDDTGSGPSVFTHLVGQGRGAVELGDALLILSGWVVAVSAVVLVALLVWDLRAPRPITVPPSAR